MKLIYLLFFLKTFNTLTEQIFSIYYVIVRYDC